MTQTFRGDHTTEIPFVFKVITQIIIQISTNLTMRNFFRIVFFVFSLLIAKTHGIAYEEERYELDETTGHSCDKMIELHKFYGTCCSIQRSDSDGCVLNVANGWCKVVGQYWTKLYNSTDDRITCRSSDYDYEDFVTPCPNPGCPASVNEEIWNNGSTDNSTANSLTYLAASALIGAITVMLI